MGISVMILFFLPWLDRSPVKSIRYRGSLQDVLAVFVISFLVLGPAPCRPTSGAFGWLGGETRDRGGAFSRSSIFCFFC
jgi:ubiquinol-cytochrome c reductase cytochrome b subunit